MGPDRSIGQMGGGKGPVQGVPLSGKMYQIVNEILDMDETPDYGIPDYGWGTRSWMGVSDSR